MSARLLKVLAGALVLGSYVHAAGHATPTARLTGVSTMTDSIGTTVVIETTEPVAYVAAQPDPLTLLVDLRNVASGQVRPERASGAVADVAIESSTSNDGMEIVRVRLLLARPATPLIRSKWNTVIIQFNSPAAQDRTAAASSASVQPGGGTPQVAAAAAPVDNLQPGGGIGPGSSTADSSGGGASPVPAPVAIDTKPVPPGIQPSPGSALTKVVTSTGPDGTRVTFSGTGNWRPGSIEAAKDLPPRVVLDFPLLPSTLPAVTPIGKGPVDRIRVAVNRRDPLVTRAVIDLKYAVGHRVESTEGGVVILFEAPAANAPAAGADQAQPGAPLTGTATPSRTRTPETAAQPRPDVKPVSLPEPKPEPKPESKPELKPEPQPAPKVEAKPEAKVEPRPEVKAEIKPAPAEARPERPAPLPQQVKPPAQKPAPPAAAEGEKQYTGHLVTFDFFQADLRSVLRTFSEISGLNVVIDPAIPPGAVDVSLREVPWDQALEVILRSHQLGYVLEHNVVRIAPLKVLAQEQTDRQKLVEAQLMSGQLKVFSKTLSYARAADVGKLLKDGRLISSRGTALVDERTNTLILNDLPEALAECESLIAILDRSEPQVEIEAKIVQTSTDTARALGVQWGVRGRMASDLGNTSGLAFPAQGSVSGRTGAQQGSPAIMPTAVNLPVDKATSALGIAMGTLTGSFNLDVALSALEKKGRGKILSQPKVMMQNNFEAEMTQGVQIPIQVQANNTTTVSFKDAALTLKVKPQITASNTVMMNVSLENASPDYSREVNGIPPIDTQRAITQVLVNDAETMVIGGIMKTEDTSSRDGVPGVSRIPLLGWLFRRETMTSDLRELLIFITPRIRR